VLASLQHQNLAAIDGLADAEGQPGLAMEPVTNWQQLLKQD